MDEEHCVYESMTLFNDTYKKSKKSCPRCGGRHTCHVTADEDGWKLFCVKCEYEAQGDDGTLTAALRKWNDAHYDLNN